MPKFTKIGEPASNAGKILFWTGHGVAAGGMLGVGASQLIKSQASTDLNAGTIVTQFANGTCAYSIDANFLCTVVKNSGNFRLAMIIVFICLGTLAGIVYGIDRARKHPYRAPYLNSDHAADAHRRPPAETTTQELILNRDPEQLDEALPLLRRKR